MRLTIFLAAALVLPGCARSAAADEAADGDVPANFAPPVADPTSVPVRTIDNAVIHDLARGKTEGVYLLDLRHVPPAMRREVAAERTEDDACRQDHAAAACTRRDQMVAELTGKGWCWGPDDEVEADRRWMRRGAGCRGTALR